ncbi:MAG: MotA/TolQ/ExbB proton channel family protein [Methylacidiphilales bacterium]|nr:MotA/TolQ/ExbB proton channel family protein [Candidatus Methylacidiphilales bacterium]
MRIFLLIILASILVINTTAQTVAPAPAAPPQPPTSPLNTAALEAMPIPTAKGESNPTLWDLVKSGEWPMIPLAIVSLIVVYLIVHFFISLRKQSIATPDLLRRIDNYISKQDLSGLASYVAERPEAVARILDAVLKFAYKFPKCEMASIEAIAETEGSRITAHMTQRITYLYDLGVLAPLLGLLGTVVGILRAFGNVVAASESTLRTTYLAGGISQALVATASGLMVGLIAMAAFSYFRGRVNHLTSYLEGTTTRIIHGLSASQK